MAAEDYERFEKIFAGTWKFERNENIPAFLDSMEAAESDRANVEGAHPTITYQRAGDNVKVVTELVPGVEFESCFQLGEVLEVKYPDVHFNITTVMKGDNLYQEVEPLKTGKPHTCTISVEGDQMTHTLSCNGISGRRVFSRVSAGQ